MNIYGIIILTALIADFVVGVVAGLLNVAHAADEVPAEFADVCDAEAYAKSQEYLRAKTRFGLVASAFGLVLTLVIWFGGGFSFLDRLVTGWFSHFILQGICFIGILVLVKGALMLPFSWYGSVVLEARFGFNRTTTKTFVLDLLKGLALGAVLGIPLLSAILWFLESSGAYGWLWCWAAVTVFALVMQIVYPRWIMPLFNKFEPLEEGELRQRILEYADRVGFSVKHLFVMDGSKRSGHSNAFVAGFGRTKRIALFDTLVEKHEVSELVAILAHEVGHWKRGHILKGLVLGIGHSGLMFFLLSVFLTRTGLFDAFGVAPSVYAGLVFFGMLYTPVEMALSLVLNAVSRRNERQADAFAAETTGSGEALADALKRLSLENLSNLTPHPVVVLLEYSHPPVLERIRSLRNPEEGA